jgi:pimeloyl-ACP methyl ester carboxylesterase
MRIVRLLTGLLLLLASAHAARIEEGEIEGAKFTIAHPAQWNGTLLLLAHGYRAEDAPLVADLSPDHLAYKTLLAEGWMIAKTSYRRNGMIIADAIADLENLRAHIAKQHAPPELVLLEGDSMGGLIVTLIAERVPDDPRLYHGAVAVGASLQSREPGGALGLNMQTQLPLIFLSNQSELAGPREYVRARIPGAIRPSPPVLFRVARDGHVNVNQRERLLALRTLHAWVTQGPSAVPPPATGSDFFNATQEPQPGPSQVVFDSSRQSFTARVSEVSAVYGNVGLNAQPADFAAIGIAKNSWFQVATKTGARRVLFGRGFDSVPRGGWVAFPSAEGFTWIGRNFENAAATAKLAVGDEVVVRRYGKLPPAPAPKAAPPLSFP